MTRVRHFMVPGLSSVDLDCGALRGLLGAGASRAQLVSSFPATVAVQEATLLTGTPPRLHGVLFSGETPGVPPLIEAWHERLDTLLHGGSFDDLESRLREAVAEAEVVLVSGCPTADRPTQLVDPIPVAPEGFRLRLDDRFVLCEPLTEGRTLPDGFLDACLRTPGIERALAPTDESAGSWMAQTDRGWILVAEPGWAFRDPDPGTCRYEPRREPVLLALGRAWPAIWPGAVHDWRVATTVLALAGEDPSGCFDAPLEGADSLRG